MVGSKLWSLCLYLFRTSFWFVLHLERLRYFILTLNFKENASRQCSFMDSSSLPASRFFLEFFPWFPSMIEMWYGSMEVYSGSFPCYLLHCLVRWELYHSLEADSYLLLGRTGIVSVFSLQRWFMPTWLSSMWSVFTLITACLAKLMLISLICLRKPTINTKI